MTNALTITTPTDRTVTLTRVFDAPRTRVFDCYTKPELVRRWLLGLPGWSFLVCEIDLRVGGSYRYVWQSADGASMGMGGVYREIVRPERIVDAQLFDEDWTGGETIGTLLLSEQAGKTTVTTTIAYASTQARDAALRTGMAEGMGAGFDRLADYLASLA
ncbi:MAG: SRPBCC family protein [Thermoflexales bacterium]